MTEVVAARRPIKTRDSKWAAWVASLLARRGIKPNAISVFSAIFAGLGGVAFAFAHRVPARGGAVLFVVAAVCIQLRLLCNLFDGMVAIEGGFKTKSGEVYNELPDRFADVFLFVGAGYGAGVFSCGPSLGWLAAVLAVGTAYVRALGAAAGAGQCFLGPMAKQHRMAVMTVAALLSSVAVFWSYSGFVMLAALGVIVAGAAITVIRRACWVVCALEAKP